MLLDEAERIIAASREHALKINVAMCIAVVNEAGLLTSFIRSDNSEICAIQLAIDKAYTALVNRMSTMKLGEESQPGGSLYGIQNNLSGRMVIFPGGIPIWRDGNLIGAVGVSGGTVEQDHECALVGAAAV
jgi:uncharacterized protein GlcG (DUF336 family)